MFTTGTSYIARVTHMHCKFATHRAIIRYVHCSINVLSQVVLAQCFTRIHVPSTSHTLISHSLSFPFLSPMHYVPHRKPSRDQSPNNPLYHYDCPRPVAYDVPRASIRSRGGSFQSSNDTLHTAISNEVKNPMYITKQG